MFKNFFTIALRNLFKNKVHSFINITGLSVGLAIAILISLWIYDEISYNKNFDNYGSIVRVKENSTAGNEIRTFNSVPIPLSADLRTHYASDFKKVVMASWNLPRIIAAGEKKLSKSGMYVQPEFTRLFSLRMIKGDLDCLHDPSAIVLNQSLARALFGNDDPINKTIRVDNKKDLKVSGVFEDFPHNCEFRDVNLLLTWDYYKADQPWVKNAETGWDDNSFQIYAQLQDKVNINSVATKVKGRLLGHDRTDQPEVLLHPISKWHLYTEFKNGINTGGDIQFVWMVGIIGLFVLLIACINFMNLSTARSERRAKEVGIRKAVGSLRRQLIFQFLIESVLMTVFALLLALVFVFLALPWFNGLADKQIHIPWGSPVFWLFTIGCILFTGLISGSYPAFYLSSFNAIKVLKGTFKSGRYATVPRKVLVVVQFTISVTLIIGTIVVYQQIQFAKNRPVGYSRGGLLTVNMNTPDLYGHYAAIRNDLIQSGAAVNMAEASSPSTDIWSNQTGFDWKGKDPNLNASFGIVRITHDYGKTIGWRVRDGRDFSRDFPSDSMGMVINESAAKYMGLVNPVGETIKHEEEKGVYKTYKVVGVVDNMIIESPFSPIKPIFYFLDYENANVVIAKANPSISIGAALPKIEAVFKKYNPGAPFEYNFADDEYAKKFNTEERISSLASFFAIFAIFISCLGLFGLASFTAAQRSKEIGVRKVLGASIFNLWRLLSRDFVVLVLISLVLASPLAYYFMEKWLKNYEYRINIAWWVFAMAGLSAMLITLFTVSFQAIKAARANPVNSLKTE